MSIREKAKQEWIDRVYDNASEVDPGNEWHWTSMALGFFIGHGFSVDEAHELIREVDEYI